jgi:hypothetical protein
MVAMLRLHREFYKNLKCAFCFSFCILAMFSDVAKGIGPDVRSLQWRTSHGIGDGTRIHPVTKHVGASGAMKNPLMLISAYFCVKSPNSLGVPISTRVSRH